MPPAPAFQQWLHSARALDWSPHRRQRSALEAFALLQETCVRSYHGSAPPPAEATGRPGVYSDQDPAGRSAD